MLSGDPDPLGVARRDGPSDAPRSGPADPEVARSLGHALPIWLHIGLNSFGGPAGQIAVMHRELVERRRWLSERRFLHGLNYCMVLPGPEAQQLAAYIGLLMNGVWGAALAGCLFVLPGALVMLVLSVAYVELGEIGWMSGLLMGLASAVIALVLQAVIRIGRRTLHTRFLVVVAVTAFLALTLLGVGFPLVLAFAVAAGLTAGRHRPGWTAASKGGGSRMSTGEAALPTVLGEDETLTVGQRRSALRAGLACLVLWLVPILTLVWALGPQHVLSEIAVTFARTALITFGGAYAVLSYVTEQASVIQGWVTPEEMATGLGLAESTPGPLILVLQFVGFLAAYNEPGMLPPLVAGTVGSLVTIWVTFVPCFMLIYLGAPFAERLRDNVRLHQALTTVSAAVVGVIANLGLWLALHTIFAESRIIAHGPFVVSIPVISSFEAGAAAIAVLAMVLVFAREWPTHRVLLVCAAGGTLLGIVGGAS